MMQLINAARRGDKEATETLFVGIYDQVRLKALKLSRDSDYEDVAQDATIRMMRVVSGFRGNSVGEFMTWVQWQVRSVAAGYRKRFQRRAEFLRVDSKGLGCVIEDNAWKDAYFDPPADPSFDRLDALEQIDIARRVDSTAVAYAEFRVEGYTDREIASGLGVERSTIRCKVYRLRKRMVAA